MFEETDELFLGRGWSFPPAFDWNHKSITIAQGEQDIRESLFLLMSTIPGERVMRPEYGCDLHGVVFSDQTEETKHRIIDLVTTAIIDHEPRIILENIEVIMDETAIDGIVKVAVEYNIIEINTRDNIVYPFYLLEGTLVDNI